MCLLLPIITTAVSLLAAAGGAGYMITFAPTISGADPDELQGLWWRRARIMLRNHAAWVHRRRAARSMHRNVWGRGLSCPVEAKNGTDGVTGRLKKRSGYVIDACCLLPFRKCRRCCAAPFLFLSKMTREGKWGTFIPARRVGGGCAKR